jgi:hypothetical protein
MQCKTGPDYSDMTGKVQWKNRKKLGMGLLFTENHPDIQRRGSALRVVPVILVFCFPVDS